MITERMTDGDLHALFCEWAAWARSRRLYSPSPNPQSIIGTLMRLSDRRDGNARLDPGLAALHLAIIGAEGRDGHILSVEYLWRPYSRPRVPVKRLAGALGVSRQRWYQLLKDARRRVYRASQGVDTIALADPCHFDQNKACFRYADALSESD